MIRRRRARRSSRRGAASRNGLILAASAAVLVAAAALSRRADRPASLVGAPSSAGSWRPSALPSGAPRAVTRAFDDGAGCSFADRGFGVYERWRPLPLGRVLVPANVDPRGFDLLVHFHGAEPVRKLLAPELDGLVIAAIDAGTLSSDYEQAVRASDALEQLVAAVEREVAAAARVPSASMRGLALSSWSAGYGAVGALLSRAGRRPRAVILLDSLYASYTEGRAIAEASIEPFLDAAARAVAGDGLFFLTHSDVPTDGYASTAEVARWLTARLGGSDRGLFIVRNAPGADRAAHCDQLRFLPEAVHRHALPLLARP